MTTTELPFDLTGCEVAQVQWPSRGFQMLLAGETTAGRSVEGARLSFTAVANQYELREFLSAKRRIERMGGVTRNRIEHYPLKLPATLTHSKLSRASKISYGDAAFTDAHGRPPAVGPQQQLYLFALKEKRFKERKPFPIIFGRLTLADGKGEVLSGVDVPPPRKWSAEEYQQLGMRFFETVVTGDLRSARQMLSKACCKRLGNSELRRRLRDYLGCAQRLAAVQPGGSQGGLIDRLRPYMYVNVEDDDELVWESVRNTPTDFPRESARAQLELGSEFLREALCVYVVEEDNQPRLELR